MPGVRGTLRAGERLIWEGRPDVNVYSLRGAWYLLPFSVLWSGFTFFWEFLAISRGAPVIFVLWGVPFVVIGIYLLVGRIYVARREAATTVYAVTDQRVLIEAGAFRRRLTQLDLRDLPMLQLEDDGRGRGTITFGPVLGFRLPAGWPTMGGYARPTMFAAIPDASHVFELLQDAKAQARLDQASTAGA